MAEDDEEFDFGGVYENGHWGWDDGAKTLIFVSDLPPEQTEEVILPIKAPTGTIEFRDDVDLIEQIRFRRRYQRKLKPGQPDVITIQDIKDIALFTAPVTILSPMLISMLHLPTTERFIRALVLCIQYYLQIADEMTDRIIELNTKIRTPQCEIMERSFRDNLSDLRLLVAKEYSTMLVGGSDTRKFHHMGPNKKRRSLSDKDARFIETFLRMCVQIVWLALGRKSFNQIGRNGMLRVIFLFLGMAFILVFIRTLRNVTIPKFARQLFVLCIQIFALVYEVMLEVNRIFKTEIFNSVEHRLHTDYITKMTKEEREVLLGHCLRHDKKLNTRSPLMNEVFCHREIDYRLMGLGVITYVQLTPRLLYMMHAVAGPEEELSELGIVLGIVGMPRSRFDTMLKPVAAVADFGKSKASVSSTSHASKSSTSSTRKSQLTVRKLYPDIVLPERESHLSYFPPRFSVEPADIRPCSDVQLRRWQNRLKRLLKLHAR